MDQLVYAYSKSTGVSVTYADVTDIGKKLEQMHLSGPTAGRFLGETLAAAAILSADLGDKDERVSLQTRVDGPICGSCADASRDGNIRGYTFIKILNEHDGDPNTTLDKILGSNGEVTIIKSNSRGIIYQTQIRCNPLNLRHAIARYYNDKLHIPTGIEIVSTSENFLLNRSAALKASRTQDGSSEAFVKVLERFNDGTISKALNQGLSIQVISSALGIEDLKIIESRPISSKCTCSREKVLYSVSCLPNEDLIDIIEKKESPEVTCHFCSTSYKVSTEEVANMLRNKK